MSMFYSWRLRARHLLLRLAVNIGLEETIDVGTNELDLPRLIGGDLIVLAVVAPALAFLLRADVMNTLTSASPYRRIPRRLLSDASWHRLYHPW
jgi:hypothetical protein